MADRASPSFIIHSSAFLYIFLFHSATVTVRLCSQEKHENTHTPIHRRKLFCRNTSRFIKIIHNFASVCYRLKQFNNR